MANLVSRLQLSLNDLADLEGSWGDDDAGKLFEPNYLDTKRSFTDGLTQLSQQFGLTAKGLQQLARLSNGTEWNNDDLGLELQKQVLYGNPPNGGGQGGQGGQQRGSAQQGKLLKPGSSSGGPGGQGRFTTEEDKRAPVGFRTEEDKRAPVQAKTEQGKQALVQFRTEEDKFAPLKAATPDFRPGMGPTGDPGEPPKFKVAPFDGEGVVRADFVDPGGIPSSTSMEPIFPPKPDTR
ncbi:hypothetical protein ACQPZF_25935 [Actinosynnema sp. CS-041913]|uniref:hypothetical protein n=1 Tax=Actinosynnema sp. CS-041913 TaxID=3239917 RepID=UPI003D8D5B19